MTSSRENLAPNLESPLPARLLHENDVLLSEEEARLWEDSERLFSANDTFVEILKTNRAHQCSMILSVSDRERLDQFLKDDSERNSSANTFLHQFHSWSELQITYESFVLLLNRYCISSTFLYFVHAFGQKTSDTDSNVGGYTQHERIINVDGANTTSYAVSCLLRYPAKHGRRNTKVPWSFRQLAVHQEYNPKTDCSTWIFLQCLNSIRKCISKYRKGQPEASESHNGGPFSLLSEILRLISSLWRAYINDLESELMAVNEKACYSKVDVKVLHDYKLSFSDAQRLQFLRKCILRSEEAVEQALETIVGLQQLQLKLYRARIAATPKCDALILIANRFQNHRRVFAALREFQCGVTQLVFEALANRNNQAMFDLGSRINILTKQTNKETATMNEISEKMQRDSRSMRVLTSAALIYMPASLVADGKLLVILCIQ